MGLPQYDEDADTVLPSHCSLETGRSQRQHGENRGINVLGKNFERGYFCIENAESEVCQCQSTVLVQGSHISQDIGDQRTTKLTLDDNVVNCHDASRIMAYGTHNQHIKKLFNEETRMDAGVSSLKKYVSSCVSMSSEPFLSIGINSNNDEENIRWRDSKLPHMGTKFVPEDRSTGLCVYQGAECARCTQSCFLSKSWSESTLQPDRERKWGFPVLQTDGPLLTDKEIQALCIAEGENKLNLQELPPRKTAQAYQLCKGLLHEDLYQSSNRVGYSLSPLCPKPSPRKVCCHGWGCDFNPSIPTPSRCKHGAYVPGVTVARSLVGSFEESVLSGRFLAGNHYQRLEGFLAHLSVTGGCWSPPIQRLPFSVTCVDGGSSFLYYASIEFPGSSTNGQEKAFHSTTCMSVDDAMAFKKRLRVPIRGRVQLVLSNPEMTPVHRFFCNYDLTDMPPGTKTFVRHKVVLLASERDAEATLTNRISQDALHKNLSRQEGVINMELEGTKESGVSSLSHNRDQFHLINRKNVGGLENVLRYALHLRFACPPSKHSQKTRRCTKESDPVCVGGGCHVDIEDQRRFYLYSDLRVVFPRSHTDSDEGKLQVEYKFPDNPRYFEYCS